MNIEQWTEVSHTALIERILDRGAIKTPAEYAAMREIEKLRATLATISRMALGNITSTPPSETDN